jgi:hypothetical protein
MTDMTLRREIPVRVRARDADYPDTRHMRHRGRFPFHNNGVLFPPGESPPVLRFAGWLSAGFGGGRLLQLSNNSLGVCPVSSDRVLCYVQII